MVRGLLPDFPVILELVAFPFRLALSGFFLLTRFFGIKIVNNKSKYKKF